jgi:hypothetical protein
LQSVRLDAGLLLRALASVCDDAVKAEDPELFCLVDVMYCVLEVYDELLITAVRPGRPDKVRKAAMAKEAASIIQ